MATHGRGLICAPMLPERLAELGIEPMVANGTDPHGTAFHVGVDLRAGATTGISAADRAATLAALADPAGSAADFTRPGHIFPLAARPGGVLRRAGHTEAAVDLAQLAGLRPAGVICEIIAVDGRMARLPDLLAFAAEHGLLVVAISDLIAYRRRRERLVERVTEARMPLRDADFTAIGYRDAARRPRAPRARARRRRRPGRARARALRVPHRRRLRLPALRLRRAAGARAGHDRRRRPRRRRLSPRPRGAGHRAAQQAARLRAAGPRPGHRRRQPRARAAERPARLRRRACRSSPISASDRCGC